MALWCEVNNLKTFLDGARAVAKLAEEPWKEIANPGGRGGWLVNTSAFTVPFAMEVHEGEMALGNNLNSALAAIQTAKPDAVTGDKTPLAYARGVVHLRALGEMLGLYKAAASFNEPWAALPADAAIQVNFSELDYGYYVKLSLDGVTPQSIGLFLAPFLAKLEEARAKDFANACNSNIWQIFMACRSYEKGNNDQWPPSLQALFPKYLDNEEVLICPATERKPSFRFFGSVSAKLAGPMCPVVYDLKGNHPGGRNVGFFDSHVKWYDEAEFQEMLDNQFRRLNDALNQARERGEAVDVDMKAVNAFFTDSAPLPAN